MEVFAADRIIRILEIDWSTDKWGFRRVLEEVGGGERETGGIVRLNDDLGNEVEICVDGRSLDAAFEDLDRNIERALSAKTALSAQIIERWQGTFHDYLDEDDRGAFEEPSLDNKGRHSQLGGPGHCPMFFRPNGAPVELVNLYRGRSVFVMGNGPSFQEIDQGLLRQLGIVTFGMNNGGHLFRPHLWACVDEPIRFLDSIWKDPTIMKFVPLGHMARPIWETKENRASRDSVADYPNVIGFRRNERFDAERWLWEGTINWGNHKDRGGGRSVMLAILRICHLLGFRQVYLVGCDFHMNEQSKYWFPEHRSRSAIRNNQYSFQRLSEYFGQLKPKFDEAGFEVYNANPKSNLEVFPFKDLEGAVAENVVDTSAGTYGMNERPKE